MKTIQKNVLMLFLGILVGAGVCYLAVGKKSATLGLSSPNADTIDTANFIPLSKAKKWVSTYDSLWARIENGPPKLQYFNIKAQDVLSALGVNKSWKLETPYRYLRMTIGYSTPKHEFKAFIQPVYIDSLNHTIPFPGGTGLFFNHFGLIVDAKGHPFGGHNQGGNSDTTYVADLNTPCPSTCGN